MAKPGIMIYFEIREGIEGLSQTEKGDLLDAMLDYGQYGTLPNFSDSLKTVWGFIRPKLEQDDKRYQENILKKKHAVYCRECKKRGKEPDDYDIWKEAISHDNV